MYSKYKASLIRDKCLSIGHTNVNVEVGFLSQSGEGKHFQKCMQCSSALTGTFYFTQEPINIFGSKDFYSSK